MSEHGTRMCGLDLLRAIAVVWVMLFHSYVVGGLGPDWQWLSRYGWMGVDLFFVLSGFLIGSQVLEPLARGQRLSFGDFYLRRSFRILPAFWVMLALYCLLPQVREAPGLESAWKFLAMVLNLAIDYRHHGAFTHAWSLCVEEHFYLVFPLLALGLARRIGPWTLALIVLAVVAAGIALRAGVWLHDHRLDPDMQLRNWYVEDIYYPTWNRLDGLLAGVVLACVRVFRPQAWAVLQRHGNVFLLAGLATVGLAMWLFADRTGLTGNAYGWPVLSLGIALLVLAGSGPGSLIGRFALPGAGWLAVASYSLYLSHKAVFHLVQTHAGAWLEGRGLQAFAVYALATLLGGAVLHCVVERPFLRLRTVLLRNRPPAQPQRTVASQVA
jgi:peptidoglycan/LPS O-acetylase OafA/YrhL